MKLRIMLGWMYLIGAGPYWAYRGLWWCNAQLLMPAHTAEGWAVCGAGLLTACLLWRLWK